MEAEIQHPTHDTAGLDKSDRYLFHTLLALLAMGLVALGVLISIGGDYGEKGTVAVLLFVAGVSSVLPQIRRHGWSYFLRAERVEREKIDSGGNVTLSDLQDIAWTPRAARATTYSAVSLGMILVAAVLLLAHQEEVTGANRDLFLVVLAIASISVVFYGVSLQFWEEAIGKGYGKNPTFLLRDWALALSSLGLLSLVTSMALAIIVINTWVGAFVGAIGVGAAVFTVEFKWRASQLRDSDPMPSPFRWRKARREILASPQDEAIVRPEDRSHATDVTTVA